MLIVAPMELIVTFREALIALAEPARSIGMSCYPESEGPQWERLAAQVFDAFVRHPISVSADREHDELPLAKYDIDFEDYTLLSWPAVPGRGDATMSLATRASATTLPAIAPTVRHDTRSNSTTAVFDVCVTNHAT